MSYTFKIMLVVTAALIMSGCAHRPLLAPCEMNDGLTPATGLIGPTGDCGPLRPVNG